jgi:metacaspase-1
MVDFLNDNPNPTFRNLMLNLSHRMHRAMLPRHQQSRAYKKYKEKWIRKYPHDTRGIEALAKTPDMTNFINPQMASPRPLVSVFSILF